MAHINYSVKRFCNYEKKLSSEDFLQNLPLIIETYRKKVNFWKEKKHYDFLMFQLNKNVNNHYLLNHN